MSSKQTQPKKEEPTKLTEQQTKTLTGFAIASIVISGILVLFFSLGASVLSYRKFGSIGWAILDFFFAYFYYPYYAFFLDTSSPAPAPAPAPTTAENMVGGMVKLLGGRRRKH